MNKEVILKNCKLFVINENGVEREIEMLDNFSEILIQENIIETIKNVIRALEDSSSIFQKNKFRDLSYIPVPIINTVITPIIMSIFNDLPELINTKFGLMNRDKFIILFITIFIPFGYHISKKWFQEYREDIKCENGRQLALVHLRDNLEIQNTKLDLIKSKSNNADISNLHSCIIEDDAVLEILQSHINMYYEIGYNLKYYYWYFILNGDLPHELKEEYNHDGQLIIKEFLENNGPKIKNKTHKKKNFN